MQRSITSWMDRALGTTIFGATTRPAAATRNSRREDISRIPTVDETEPIEPIAGRFGLTFANYLSQGSCLNPCYYRASV